jgi:hypothetical protein
VGITVGTESKPPLHHFISFLAVKIFFNFFFVGPAEMVAKWFSL